MCWYDIIQLVGSVLSSVSFVLVLITLLRVSTLRKAVSVQSIRHSVHSLFDDTSRIPPNKVKLTSTQRDNVNEILTYSKLFFISKNPLKQRPAKKLVKKVTKELEGAQDAQKIKRDMGLLKDQLFFIAGGR